LQRCSLGSGRYGTAAKAEGGVPKKREWKVKKKNCQAVEKQMNGSVSKHLPITEFQNGLSVGFTISFSNGI